MGSEMCIGDRARCEAGILFAEAGAGLLDDLREALEGLLRLDHGRLPHRQHLDAEGADELAHRLLRLDEGAGDVDLRGAEVGAQGGHLAVHATAPFVERGHECSLAHVFPEVRSENDRASALRLASTTRR